MLKVKVGELLPGSVFKISDESDKFLIIDKNTACLMFYYDSNEMSAAVNTTTGKMISIENNKDVIPLITKIRKDIRNLELYDSYKVYTKAELYILFKINKGISDLVLDKIFDDINEEHPVVVRIRNLNKTFIVSQHKTSDHRTTVYEIKRVQINEVAV